MRLLSVAAKIVLLAGVALLGFTVFSSPTIVSAADTLCGAPANPWNINYCPSGGAEITSANLPAPTTSICMPAGPFTCVSDIATHQNGYMVECGNGKLSMSGGVQGACGSGDGGVKAPAYLGAAAAPSTTSPPTTAPPATTQPTAPPTTAAPPMVSPTTTSPAPPAVPPATGPLAMTGPGRGVALIALTGAGLVVVGASLQLACYGPADAAPSEPFGGPRSPT